MKKADATLHRHLSETPEHMLREHFLYLFVHSFVHLSESEKQALWYV